MTCDQCGADFSTQKALAGHIGGKHGDVGGRAAHKHGTNKGYQWHIRHKVPFDTCPDGQSCRTARATYVRGRRARKAAGFSTR